MAADVNKYPQGPRKVGRSYIDDYLFEQQFLLFLDHVERFDGESFMSFPRSDYTNDNEGYKDAIHALARRSLRYRDWSFNEVGHGSISNNLISSLKLEGNINNLVHWRDIQFFEEKTSDPDHRKRIESIFYDFFHKKCSDEKSLAEITNELGRKYPLIAYFFFLKDKAQYMPISPKRFDEAFRKLGVTNFKTSKKFSWNNYLKFNDILRDVKQRLIFHGIQDVSLLHAHSFCWIISGLEGSGTSKILKNINQYKGSNQKSREAIIQARIGQGPYRGRLLELWTTCSVTGCTEQRVLTASHAKPWAQCSPIEATDHFNGFLLAPNMNALFDLGFITFADQGEIIISDKLSQYDREIMGISPSLSLRRIFQENIPYLRYHRDHVFKQ